MIVLSCSEKSQLPCCETKRGLLPTTREKLKISVPEPMKNCVSSKMTWVSLEVNVLLFKLSDDTTAPDDCSLVRELGVKASTLHKPDSNSTGNWIYCFT